LPLCLLVEGADPNVADALSHLDWRFPLRVTEICHRPCCAMVHKPPFLHHSYYEMNMFLLIATNGIDPVTTPVPSVQLEYNHPL
jgi:hypothetical protein